MRGFLIVFLASVALADGGPCVVYLSNADFNGVRQQYYRSVADHYEQTGPATDWYRSKTSGADPRTETAWGKAWFARPRGRFERVVVFVLKDRKAFETCVQSEVDRRTKSGFPASATWKNDRVVISSTGSVTSEDGRVTKMTDEYLRYADGVVLSGTNAIVHSLPVGNLRRIVQSGSTKDWFVSVDPAAVPESTRNEFVARVRQQLSAQLQRRDTESLELYESRRRLGTEAFQLLESVLFDIEKFEAWARLPRPGRPFEAKMVLNAKPKSPLSAFCQSITATKSSLQTSRNDSTAVSLLVRAAIPASLLKFASLSADGDEESVSEVGLHIFRAGSNQLAEVAAKGAGSEFLQTRVRELLAQYASRNSEVQEQRVTLPTIPLPLSVGYAREQDHAEIIVNSASQPASDPSRHFVVKPQRGIAPLVDLSVDFAKLLGKAGTPQTQIAIALERLFDEWNYKNQVRGNPFLEEQKLGGAFRSLVESEPMDDGDWSAKLRVNTSRRGVRASLEIGPDAHRFLTGRIIEARNRSLKSVRSLFGR